jgi:hypothetical protein
MKCPKCKTSATKKQFNAVMYGEDGTNRLICEKCKNEYFVYKTSCSEEQVRKIRDGY